MILGRYLVLGYLDCEGQMQFGAQKTPGGSKPCPSTQYLRLQVPKTMPLMAFGTRSLKYWVLGASGDHMSYCPVKIFRGKPTGPESYMRSLVRAVLNPQIESLVHPECGTVIHNIDCSSHTRKDPTNACFWSPLLAPLNQSVGSLCLCDFWAADTIESRTLEPLGMTQVRAPGSNLVSKSRSYGPLVWALKSEPLQTH